MASRSGTITNWSFHLIRVRTKSGFGLPPRAASPDTRIVVVELAIDGDPVCVGLTADISGQDGFEVGHDHELVVPLDQGAHEVGADREADPIPLADLRVRFGLPPRAASPDTRIVVVELAIDGDPSPASIAKISSAMPTISACTRVPSCAAAPGTAGACGLSARARAGIDLHGSNLTEAA
jgi:hypothetical protein